MRWQLPVLLLDYVRRLWRLYDARDTPRFAMLNLMSAHEHFMTRARQNRARASNARAASADGQSQRSSCTKGDRRDCLQRCTDQGPRVWSSGMLVALLP